MGAMRLAAAEPDEGPELDRLLDATVRLCRDVDAWLSAARTYPKAIGWEATADDVDADYLNFLCALPDTVSKGLAEAPTCLDAYEKELIPDPRKPSP